MQTYPLKNYFAVFIALFFAQTALAQLPDFSLQVTATNETCTGNGTLTFATANATPGATMVYSVYLLPETTIPLAVLSGTTLTGLSAGTYQVVALQTLGNESNSQQQEVVITNQIVPLTFTVAGTPESCANGTITVTAQGNAAFYEIIAGPVLVPPQISNVFEGLPSGAYNIRVTDTCGDAYVQTYTLLGASYLVVTDPILRCRVVDCDTGMVDFSVMINPAYPQMEIVYPLTVTITVIPPQGGAPITITEVVNSGSNNLLEMVTNIPFYEGQSYVVNISVADSCGHVFTNDNNSILQALEAEGEQIGPPSGISITACYGMPPYTVQFTSAPPGFDPSLFNPNHPGPFMSLPINYISTPEHEMPDGEYDFVITDSCGNSTPGNCGVSSCPIDSKIIPICPKGGRLISPSEAGSPLETGFIMEAPADFGHPLPFDLAPYISAAGFLSIELPPGTYLIQGMSRCPKPYEFAFTIEEPSIVTESANLTGCATNTGSMGLTLMNGTSLVSVIITGAPAGFTQTLPYDASALVQADEPTKWKMQGLMYGSYTLSVTDACGNIYPVSIDVPLLISQSEPTMTSLPGCAIGYGSIAMVSANNRLVQVIITGAPAAYGFALPHDVSFGISPAGVLSLNTLPEGTYTFFTRDVCGVEHTFQRTFNGYHIVVNDFELRGHCGSFDLFLRYSPVIPYAQFFWLQRLNPVTGQWGHPITGVPFNTVQPNDLNSYLLANNSTNYNIAVLGQFRILRVNLIHSPASTELVVCTETIREFTFDGQLRITSAYSVPCSNGVSQVIVVAGDTFPLRYRITEKDGQPFLVENGTSNLFAGLAPGIYNFQVEDDCGNIANRVFDIISLAEPQITAHNLCNGQNGYLAVQGISYLSYQWWNAANPGTIISTSSNLYFSPFSQTTSPGTYVVRIYSTTPVSCIDTTVSYTIPPMSSPNAGLDATVTLCGSGQSIDLFTLLGGTFDATGFWQETTSSGMLSGHYWLPVSVPVGTYVFTYRVNGFCDDFDTSTVTVNLHGAAPVPVVSVQQEQCSGGVIVFSANDIPGATYHWDGPNGYASEAQNPEIPNSLATHSGTYTLTVDVNGCTASATAQVDIDGSPDFNLSQACQTGTYVLKAEAVGESFDPDAVTYSWTGPQNFSSSANPAVITGLPAGPYELTVSTSEGCSLTKSILVAQTRCEIPNGISPNDDGDNDTFDLTGFDVLKFKIFSRYGRMVYEQDDYTNQWHGQDFNDRQLPDATYYYYIRFRTGEEKTGWVYVNK